MGDSVSWIIEITIKDGRLDIFKSLVEEMLVKTQANEPEKLNYEFFLNADGKSCEVHERYADSDATIAHLGAIGDNFAERFMSVAEQNHCAV